MLVYCMLEQVNNHALRRDCRGYEAQCTRLNVLTCKASALKLSKAPFIIYTAVHLGCARWGVDAAAAGAALMADCYVAGEMEPPDGARIRKPGRPRKAAA